MQTDFSPILSRLSPATCRELEAAAQAVVDSHHPPTVEQRETAYAVIAACRDRRETVAMGHRIRNRLFGMGGRGR